jgi:sulfate adenylyltransferase subunit 2
VPLYLSAERPVITRNNMLIMVDDDQLLLHRDEKVQMERVRFRTLGCYPLTGAVRSEAATVEDIIQECSESNVSERHGRLIDHDNAASMEKKKREGYF